MDTGRNKGKEDRQTRKLNKERELIRDGKDITEHEKT
jgi:hypothetical protein